MYDLFFSSGTGHSLMVLAFTIALGLLLGKIKIKGVSLGAIWVLFVGILFGALGVKADSLFLHFLKEFGLILFVFSIGLQVGPGFFHSFRRQGLRLNLLAMLLVLVSAGCQWTILGHSERRQYYGETDAKLVDKVRLALDNGLGVILCVGENLEEREALRHFEVVKTQTENVLFHFTAEEMAKIVIAYEPVWAIGTGKTATAAQAEEIHACIRNVIEAKFGAQVADDMTILYGGSCKPSNAKELFAEKDIDGGLIGGAALKADDFIGIALSF